MKIQNSYKSQQKKSPSINDQRFNEKKNTKKQTQTNKRLDRQKKTPLPLIRINGQLKNVPDNDKKPEQNQEKTPKLLEEREDKIPIYKKKHKITKKKINFEINYNNIEKKYKQFGSLFVHALSNLSCDRRFVQIQEQDSINRNFPQPIVNIFYGQNVHKYNPYIEVLDRLYESFRGKVSRQMMERIKKLCYIGLAKSHLKSQKYSQTPKYSRVNILIRTYMYENMNSIIEQRAQNYENIVFIPCNKDAMSFSQKQFPEELALICRRQNFEQTIQNVNRIIEEHYMSYKQMNSKQTVTDRWGQNLCYLLTILFFVIFLLSNNIVFIYILGFFILSSLLLYLYETRQTLSMLGSSKNIIHKIQESLQSYLSEINTHNMEWKVGQDFYWLEIHYIKKMKKKPFKHNQQ